MLILYLYIPPDKNVTPHITITTINIVQNKKSINKYDLKLRKKKYKYSIIIKIWYTSCL